MVEEEVVAATNELVQEEVKEEKVQETVAVDQGLLEIDEEEEKEEKQVQEVTAAKINSV